MIWSATIALSIIAHVTFVQLISSMLIRSGELSVLEIELVEGDSDEWSLNISAKI